MSSSSNKGVALITGASAGIGGPSTPTVLQGVATTSSWWPGMRHG